MFRFFFLLLLLMLLPDLYLWLGFTRGQHGVWRTLVLIAPTVATIAFILLMFCNVRVALLMQWAFVLLICVSIPKLAFVLVDVAGRGLVWNSARFVPAVHRVALTFAVVVAAAQVYGTAWGWRRLGAQHTDLTLPNLPKAFRGYKVVQISDLHLGSYAGDTSVVRHLTDSVNALRPDLIVFTGDIVNTASAEIAPYASILKELRAKDGVLSILGNHDYCMYQPGLTPTEQAREVARVVEWERRMGWTVLLNAHRAISRGSDTLYVAGVENVGKPPFPERGDLSKAMTGIPTGACTILLSHDPWHWRHGVLQNGAIPLTLSGHTHALQLQVGAFSPASWFMKEWGGRYEENGRQLYVSTGVGGSVPYRLGAWPKIEVFTLR